MGSRTRNHIIEDESRNQFRSMLPSQWVIRDKTNDYGIDLEVELFDASGRSMGLLFWVQLKATDAEDTKTIRHIRFPQSKLVQLTSYPVPVLITRYSTKEKRFYTRWAKNIALFNSNKNQKYLNIEFTEEHLWTLPSSLEIENYLVKVKQIRDGEFRLPLPYFVKSNMGAHFMFQVRSDLQKRKNLFDLQRNQEDAQLMVYLEKDRVLISLMDQWGASFDYGLDVEDQGDKIAVLVPLGLLIVFANQSRYNLFEKVLQELELETLVRHMPEVLTFLIPHLLKCGNLERTLQTISDALENKGDLLNQAVLHSELLKLRSLKDQTIQEELLNYFHNQLEQSERNGDNTLIAAALYNLGQFYKGMANYYKAIQFYNRARKFDRKYESRDYFFQDLGGILFEASKFTYAAKFYKKALELNPEHFKVALYGDALMFSGGYKEALSLYDKYLLETSPNDFFRHEISIKYTCLTTLINSGYPPHQKRNTAEANYLADPNNLAEGEEFIEKMENALDKDLLCAVAWFNLGQEMAKAGKMSNCLIAFLMCALINRPDTVAWINATVLCLDEKEAFGLLPNIVNAAYYYCGEDYMIELSEHIQKNWGDSHSEFLKMIDNLVERPHDPPRELRILGEGDVIRISM
jgi:tetratricopeptide (TPR) repeat protein